MLDLTQIAKQAAENMSVPARMVRYYAPIGDRRDTLEPQENQAIAAGEKQWMPKIIQTDATPVSQMLASPARQGLLAGGVGGALGAMAGGYLGKGMGNAGVGAVIGGLAAGVPAGISRFIGQHHRNDHLTEVIRRLPPGATKRDYDAEKMLNSAYDDRYKNAGDYFAKLAMKDPSYDPKHKDECCPSCGARLERGDDGKCNRCGKPWPEKKAAQRTCSCGTQMRGAWCPKCRTFDFKKKAGVAEVALIKTFFKTSDLLSEGEDIKPVMNEVEALPGQVKSIAGEAEKAPGAMRSAWNWVKGSFGGGAKAVGTDAATLARDIPPKMPTINSGVPLHASSDPVSVPRPAESTQVGETNLNKTPDGQVTLGSPKPSVATQAGTDAAAVTPNSVGVANAERVQPGGVSNVITPDMKTKLISQGYPPDQVERFTPTQASSILAGKEMTPDGVPIPRPPGHMPTFNESEYARLHGESVPNPATQGPSAAVPKPASAWRPSFGGAVGGGLSGAFDRKVDNQNQPWGWTDARNAAIGITVGGLHPSSVPVYATGLFGDLATNATMGGNIDLRKRLPLFHLGYEAINARPGRASEPPGMGTKILNGPGVALGTGAAVAGVGLAGKNAIPQAQQFARNGILPRDPTGNASIGSRIGDFVRGAKMDISSDFPWLSKQLGRSTDVGAALNPATTPAAAIGQQAAQAQSGQPADVEPSIMHPEEREAWRLSHTQAAKDAITRGGQQVADQGASGFMQHFGASAPDADRYIADDNLSKQLAATPDPAAQQQILAQHGYKPGADGKINVQAAQTDIANRNAQTLTTMGINTLAKGTGMTPQVVQQKMQELKNSPMRALVTGQQMSPQDKVKGLCELTGWTPEVAQKLIDLGPQLAAGGSGMMGMEGMLGKLDSGLTSVLGALGMPGMASGGLGQKLLFVLGSIGLLGSLLGGGNIMGLLGGLGMSAGLFGNKIGMFGAGPAGAAPPKPQVSSSLQPMWGADPRSQMPNTGASDLGRQAAQWSNPAYG